MPISAKLFKIKSFPEEFPVETVPTNTGLGDNFELVTKVEKLGVAETRFNNQDLIKLKITHDNGDKFEGVGYSLESGRITDLISIAQEKEFPAFVFPEKDYIFPAYSNKVTFNKALRRLSQYSGVLDNSNQLITAPLKLDLQELIKSLDSQSDAPTIRGGWFKELNITNVDVAYIGGGAVEDSDEWFKYETSGKISALRLDYPNADIEEEPFRLLLTSDCSIFSYKNFSENEFLKILLPIFDYIKQFIED